MKQRQSEYLQQSESFRSYLLSQLIVANHSSNQDKEPTTRDGTCSTSRWHKRHPPFALGADRLIVTDACLFLSKSAGTAVIPQADSRTISRVGVNVFTASRSLGAVIWRCRMSMAVAPISRLYTSTVVSGGEVWLDCETLSKLNNAISSGTRTCASRSASSAPRAVRSVTQNTASKATPTLKQRLHLPIALVGNAARNRGLDQRGV